MRVLTVWVLALIAMTLAILGLGFATTAHASVSNSSCAIQSHCYGIDNWLPAPTNTGAIMTLNDSQLDVLDECNGFATSELWVGSINGGGYWVEEGVIHGQHPDSSCGNGIQWVYAYTDTSGHLHAFFPGGAFGLNTNYSVKIAWNGSAWGFYRNGSLLGTQVGAGCCSAKLAAGTEVSQPNATVHGTATGLQKQPQGSGWSYGWGGSFVQFGGATAGWLSGQSGTGMYFNYTP